MGATTSSNTKRYSEKFNSNIYSTPPKLNYGGKHDRLVQLQYDPRSPTGKTINFFNLFYLFHLRWYISNTNSNR